MKKLFIAAINFYRNYISTLKLPTCRFHPTCSQYAASAIEQKGLSRGLFLSAKRLLKCHPFSKGGFDPVE